MDQGVAALKSDQHEDGDVQQINRRIKELLKRNQINTKMGLFNMSTKGSDGC